MSMRLKIAALLLAAATPVLASNAVLTITSLATGTSDVLLVAAAGTGARSALMFCGFSARETVGSAAATVVIYNGTDATGVKLFEFSLTASESRSEGPWSGSECLLAVNGVFIDRGGTGSTALTVYTRNGLLDN